MTIREPRLYSDEEIVEMAEQMGREDARKTLPAPFTAARFRVPGGRVRHRRRIGQLGLNAYSLCRRVDGFSFDWQETEEGPACKRCEELAARAGEEGAEDR